MLLPTYPLRTQRLLLRPFTFDDLEELYAFHSMPEVAEFMYWEPRGREEVREALALRVRSSAIAAEGDGIGLAVVLGDTGGMIGETNLDWSSKANRQAEVGFAMHPGYQGLGYGVEAVAAMLDLGFGQFGLHRVFGRCNARNTGSARLMTRLGMRLEAHLRESEFVKGSWVDVYEYAILSTEWAELRTDEGNHR